MCSPISFVEQDNVFKLGNGDPVVNTQKVAIPLKLFNCPSRRAPIAYPNPNNYGYYNATGISPTFGKTDYAACAGSQNKNETDGGPTSFAIGDTESYWSGRAGDTALYNGPFFPRSQIALVTLTRGTSNTIVFGEKYMNPATYTTGTDPSDNESLYVGMDNDIYRCTFSAPLQDLKGYQDTRRFGSAHIGGLQVCMGDGSIRNVAYSVNPAAWAVAGNRASTSALSLDQ